MPINQETIERTAKLAQLDLAWGQSGVEAQATVAKVTGELSALVGYLDVLSQAETSGVEPLYSPLLEAPGLRADIPHACEEVEAIFEQTPAHFGNYFTVPKIV